MSVYKDIINSPFAHIEVKETRNIARAVGTGKKLNEYVIEKSMKRQVHNNG